MKTITLEQFDCGIYQLQLNRPNKYNAFNAEMIAEINTALSNLRNESNCKLLLITANGKHFSAGADLKWMQQTIHYSKEENINDAKHFADMLYQLKHFPAPTIALVQGKTFGGGIGIIACCDFAIAETNASFCFSEAKIGLIPAVISPYIIELLGPNHAKRLFLTAEQFTATEAQEYGLISELAVAQPLFDIGMNLAEQLLQNSPQALRQIKTLLANLTNAKGIHEMIATTCGAIADIRVSNEGQEGLNAFLEKRKPQWDSVATEEE